MSVEENLLSTAQLYRKQSAELITQGQGLNSQQLLSCLTLRDYIEQKLEDGTSVDGETANEIAEGDDNLHKIADIIARVPQLEKWRRSFHPPEAAWWWHFTPETTSDRPQWDWLWTAMALLLLAISVSFILDIIPRFLGGGPDPVAAFAISMQTLLTLATTGAILTERGRNAAKKAFMQLRLIPKVLWEEIGLVAATLLLVFSIAFWFSLDRISLWYNDQAACAYQQRELTSARHLAERAIRLDPDNGSAHYLLGVLYEDLHQRDDAKSEYQLAAATGLDVAYNNLGRLYLLEAEADYSTALHFLRQGLALHNAQQDQNGDENATRVAVNPFQGTGDCSRQFVATTSPSTIIRYSFYKNLGWAFHGQKRYAEAKYFLDLALEENTKLGSEPSAAHCLLAQTLTATEESEEAIRQNWEACNKWLPPLDKVTRQPLPEEELWHQQMNEYFARNTSQEGDSP